MRAWLIAALVSSAAAGANVLGNPSFELADAGEPAFWEARTPSDGERELSWSAEVARSGARSLRITHRADVRSRWRSGQLHELALQPGTRATLSGWIRTRGVAGGAHLRLYLMSADDTILAQPDSPRVSGDAEWTEVRVEHPVPDQPVYAMAYLELDGRGSAWFDDVALEGEPMGGVVGRAPVVTVGPADLWECAGWETVQRSGRTVLQLRDGAAGEALVWFEGSTARYDLTVAYLDEFDGASTLSLELEGRALGEIRFDGVAGDGREEVREWTLAGVDLQRYRRLWLRGRGDGGEPCRWLGITFRVSGAYGGELRDLPCPPRFDLYTDDASRGAARGMLSAWLTQKGVRPATERREAELAALRTPADWQAYTQRIRARLSDYFGPFPERTPLNPKVVGTIERDRFVIERLYFESRPNHFVSANFYRPTDGPLPVPGVLFVCGHSSEGKGYHLYHECCLGLVLKGYAVLAIDPMGQGERIEYHDPQTLADILGGPVAQHQQLLRPALLVGRTLSGHRVWDAVRGVDYLLTRPEVAPDKLAVVGNSGGGQMAFLAAAVDERIDVCVAAHPGGSCENTYLNGYGLRDLEVLSLIAPRPCRVVVGRDSGEDHGGKVQDMLRFYRGLGYGEERCQLVLVDGVHNLERPKREAAYEWLNQWFGKTAEGAEEPPLEPLAASDLWATAHGNVLVDLGGESGVGLNLARYRELRPTREMPRDEADARAQQAVFRAAVARRLGWSLDERRSPPPARQAGTLAGDGFTAEQWLIETEPGIRLPAVRLVPPGGGGPLVVHAAEWGKPRRADRPSLPLELCRRGSTVLSIDVRGVGETDPRAGLRRATANGWDPDNWTRDVAALNSYGYLGRALDGLRAVDIVRAIDHLAPDGPVTVVGEGLGGLWALFAGLFDDRIGAVVTVGTLYSYEPLVASPLYEVRGYFFIPEAMRDFDLVELAGGRAGLRVTWVDPIDPLARPAEASAFDAANAWAAALAGMTGGRSARRDSAAGDLGEVAAIVREVAGGE